MYNFNEEVGYRIFKARSEKGITLKELGDLIGIAESTAQRYEKGKIKSLDIEMIKRIAKALNVTILIKNGFDFKTISELIGDTVEMVIKTYSHFTTDMFESAQNRINKIL